MPDPNVVYIVTAVVVLGLVAWVVVVLSRPIEHASGAEKTSSPLPPSGADAKKDPPGG